MCINRQLYAYNAAKNHQQVSSGGVNIAFLDIALEPSSVTSCIEEN